MDASLRGGFQIPKLDPLLVVSAMAAVTTNLAFGLTSSTTYEPPFALARRYTTLDHLTNGRVAWNVVTSHLTSAARQFGYTEAIEHDKRYEIADEYMDVVYKLWESSWHDDAVKRDQEKGIWTEPSLQFISHPSPQRTPALYQAGSSGAGTTFGAKHAEAVFIAQPTPKLAGLKVAEYRAKVAAVGRDPRSLKVIPGLLVFVAETDAEAEEKYAYWKSKGDGEVALAFSASGTGADWAEFAEGEEIIYPPGTGGHAYIENLKRAYPEVTKWTREELRQHLTLSRVGAVVVGSAETVADEMERWVEIDGFNLTHYSRNNTFEDIVNILIPVLQRRGLFWDDYPDVPQPAGATEKIGITAREGLVGVGQKHLHPTHYGHQFKWVLDTKEAGTEA
ncbi:hypothetical protein MNV49_002402 [Pseudohyphozyma bogoriensis]|nr:hypothetical protein MNV49_002402 [Pseudohyphozyma bogoriensis]